MEVKTFEEACAARGYDAATVLPNVSMFPVKHQKSILAFAMLIIIAEAINDGKEPNWNDSDEYKWYPWFDMEKEPNNPSGFRFYVSDYGCTYTRSTGGSRLCFRTRKASDYAAKQFESLWRDMMVIE